MIRITYNMLELVQIDLWNNMDSNLELQELLQVLYPHILFFEFFRLESKDTHIKFCV